MEACYAGGEQFGAAAEYGAATLCCGDSLDSLGELAASCELIAECEPRPDYDDMASFSLPSLDLDPLPALFPFSPCSGNYKGSECKEKGGDEVLLSLRHAAAHAAEDVNSPHQLAVHSQMMVTPGGTAYPYYEQYAGSAAPLFPTMSVNVSMNMTMHGYPPDQMCPQMQWNQSTPAPSVSVMYPQSQGMISPTSYPGAATYSFTADFRTPTQSDPLITASSSFKPIQIGQPNSKSNNTIPNYNIFSPSGYSNINQKVQNHIPTMPQMKTRSSSKTHLGEHQHHQQMANGYGPILNQGQMNAQEFEYLAGNLNIQPPMPGGGKVQMGSPSGCSGSEDEQKPNLCRICGKTYARPSTLKTHLRTHSGERPYRCVDCNKSFSQAANLTAHVRTHTGQKPFRCPICDRRFSQSSSVTTHMRTHSGERPYRCRACKKAFSDSSTLTKHLRIHSGEKPYQCKLCLLRFSQSGNLNRHMRVHGNNATGLIG